MPRTCSVPGCDSGRSKSYARRKALGLRPLSVFAAPRDDERQKEWRNALNCNIEKIQFVCELHFADKHIKKNDTFKLRDGTTSCIPRDHWVLEKNAVPMTHNERVEHCEENKILPDLQRNNIAMDNTSYEIVTVKCENIKTDDHYDPDYEDFQLHGDVAVDPSHFSIRDLKRVLSSALLPECWAWSQKGSEIFFTNFDQLDFSVRLHLVVKEDLSISIRTITDKTIDLKDTVKSIADVIDNMRMTRKFTVCKGTDVESERRATYCTGILDAIEEYARTSRRFRCLRCRHLRKMLLRKRPTVPVQQQLAATKKSAQLERRKFLRLQQKIAISKEDVTDLQAKCAAVEAGVLEKAIAGLPDTQQDIVRSCFEASKVKYPNKRRYTIKWIYECLLMRIKNPSLYDHIRDRGILPLPCRKTLSRYV